MKRAPGILMFLAILAACGIVFYALRTCPVPTRKLICSLQPGTDDHSFVCPKGIDFTLVVGVPNESELTKLRGTISLRIGTNTAAIRLEDATFAASNWLKAEGQEGYLIHETPDQHLDKLLKAGVSVTLHASLQEAESTTATLWLAYVTPWVDIKLTP